MSKGRTEGSLALEHRQTPIYLDSAFKQLIRQEHKASSLKNRARALQLNQERLLKQIENNQTKWTHLQRTQQNHSVDVDNLKKDRQAKEQETQKQKAENSKQKLKHQRQMSLLALEKAREIERLKKEAQNFRKENHKLIEENRENQVQKKKQVRNKIHDDIVESRITIKNFFTQKHEQIVAANTQEVKKLNLQRVKEELEAMSSAGREVACMESQIKNLRQTLHLSRVAAPIEKKEASNRISKYEQEQKHPLVRRIESVMNKYTKFL